MDAQEILEYRAKLTPNPETGAREINVADLPQDKYVALRPYLSGDEAWPEGASPASATDADAAAAQAAADAAAEAQAAADAEAEAAAAAAAVTEPAQPPKEVAVAKSTIERAKQRKEKYSGLIAEQNAIIAEPLPDRFLDENAYFEALERRQEALNKKSELATDYAMSRDMEDAEAAESVVHQSEFAHTVDAIGSAYEALKLPKSYDALVGEYGDWCRKAMATAGTEDHQAAFSRFQTDAEFAKQVGPLPQGWETLFIYMNAEAARQKLGGTLKGHVLEIAHDQGVFKKMRAADRDAAALALADKNDKALHTRSTEARPASVTSGSSDAPEGPTIIRDKESARKWLTEMQAKRSSASYRPTAEQKAVDARNEKLAREWVLGVTPVMQMPSATT